MHASQNIFVYGTLKRGECRERCWPHAPRSVQPGFIRGQLVDLGPFPGLIAGDGWVRGEVWEIRAADLPATLETLDAIEGYQQPYAPDQYAPDQYAPDQYEPDQYAPDQYERLTVAVFATPGQPSIGFGFTYRLVDPVLCRQGTMLPPSQRAAGVGYAEWSATDG
jgi:gamma-glutamylcyclotransferase (GGCT)/AIG2-like uncharacterized protein YtfP